MKRDKRNHRIKKVPQNNSIRRQRSDRGKGAVTNTLNHTIDAYQIPIDINESIIESILEQWEQPENNHLPERWLVAARLFEMSIVSAGHYVDHCEFKSAGDLLVNPRRILIYQKDYRHPLVKQRHGRLSEQLNGPEYRSAEEPFPRWFRNRVTTQISRPAILPHLLNCMEQSGRLSQCYLKTARWRLKKASQAIGFLCSWSVSDAQNLYFKLQSASSSTRRFIHHHLCLFDTTQFDALGEEIHRLNENPEYRSDFIIYPALFDATSNQRRRS